MRSCPRSATKTGSIGTWSSDRRALPGELVRSRRSTPVATPPGDRRVERTELSRIDPEHVRRGGARSGRVVRYARSASCLSLVDGDRGASDAVARSPSKRVPAASARGRATSYARPARHPPSAALGASPSTAPRTRSETRVARGGPRGASRRAVARDAISWGTAIAAAPNRGARARDGEARRARGLARGGRPDGRQKRRSREGLAASVGAYRCCGVEGDRTPDLIHAMDALSQLSYDPGKALSREPRGERELLYPHAQRLSRLFFEEPARRSFLPGFPRDLRVAARSCPPVLFGDREGRPFRELRGSPRFRGIRGSVPRQAAAGSRVPSRELRAMERLHDRRFGVSLRACSTSSSGRCATSSGAAVVNRNAPVAGRLHATVAGPPPCDAVALVVALALRAANPRSRRHGDRGLCATERRAPGAGHVATSCVRVQRANLSCAFEVGPRSFT